MKQRTILTRGEIIHFHDESGESCVYLDEEGLGLWGYDGHLRMYVEGKLIFNLSGYFVAWFHEEWIMSGNDGTHALFCKYSIGELKPPICMRKHMYPRVASEACEPKMESVKLVKVKQSWTMNPIEMWSDQELELVPRIT